MRVILYTFSFATTIFAINPMNLLSSKEISSIDSRSLNLQPISLAKPVSADYIVGPGDFFEIVADEQSYTIQVSAEGYLSFNRLGGIKVSGLTLADTKKAALELLSKRFLKERCFVQLSQPRKQVIGVFGAVKKPGYYDVQSTINASEILEEAGGNTIDAQLDSVKVIHKSGDTTHLNLYKVFRTADTKSDLSLKMGDVIYVPKQNLSSQRIYVITDTRSIPLTWHSQKSIYDYLNQADEYNKAVDTSRSPIKISNIILYSQGSSKDIPLKETQQYTLNSGDTVRLFDKNYNIYVGGQVQKPGSYIFSPNTRPLDYIAKAGISNPLIDQLDRVRVIRNSGKIEYIDIMKDQLQPGDYIEVDYATVDYISKWTPAISSVISVASVIGTLYLGYLTYELQKDKK